LTRFTSLKIDDAVICEYGHGNAEEIYRFFFYVQNEMSCTKHITAFSFGDSFPIAAFKHSSITSVWSLHFTTHTLF